MDLSSLSIEQLQQEYTNNSVRVREVVAAYQESAKEKNDELNVYVEVFDDVEEDIKRAEAMLENGSATDLTGVPVALKDNILIEGRNASAGSKMLENYTATYNATVITKLQEAGAIILGRTNMDEFAMGSSTENSYYGPTKNPLNPELVPGGSSGGSAAAVAMNGALVSLGSDTGGSIRQPASFCGCVGLTPTYGSVSRYGLMALGSSLDVIGPMGKTVADVASTYRVIAGSDSNDSTSYERESDTKEAKTIGVPWGLVNQEGVEQEVIDNFKASIEKLKALGYTITDISLDLASYALPMYYIIMPAEASSNLARYDGIRYGYRSEGQSVEEAYTQTREGGFGDEVKRRVLLGTYVLSSGYHDAYYRKAVALRQKIKTMFNDSFQSVDVIALPTTPTRPFKIGERNDDPVAMYLSDLLTVPANIAGLPALSVPSGQDAEDGSFGLQIIGSYDTEERLFSVGQSFESQV